MKRILLSCIVAVVLAFSATVRAAPVSVDFSFLMVNGVDSAVDITSPASITVNGVTFTYDNFGTPINDLGNPVFAQAQSFGIFGNPNNGVLLMSFDRPVTGLSFVYSNLSDATGTVGDALQALFGFANGDLNGIVNEAGSFNVPSTFSYEGPAFTNASLFFAFEALFFTIDTIAYEPASVPEPASIALLALGLIGLGVMRRRNAA